MIFSLPCLAETTNTISLASNATSVELWPAVTILSDPEKKLGLAAILLARDQFTKPNSAYATLGFRKDAVWLKIPLQLEQNAGQNWVFDLNYPAIERMDVYLLKQGELQQHSVLGSFQTYDKRPIPGRTHAVNLVLQPGSSYELFLRVDTYSGLILPITLNRPIPFHEAALNEHFLQGLLNGLGICLLVYSLAQWINLRDSLYAKYALLITGSLTYSIFHFGIGSEYLWRDHIWFETHIGGMSSTVAIAGSCLFIEQVLAAPGTSRMFTLIMKACAALCGIVLLVYAADLIDGLTLSWIVIVLAPIPIVMGVPGAIRRSLAGDSVGTYFFAAWVTYLTSTTTMISLIEGKIGCNFWTQHSFQIGATFDMLMFMRVLGLRTRAMQTAALQTATERDRLLSLAHTDPLTGLLNRRGMNSNLLHALANSSEEKMLAIYIMDLDGFKQINDQHGHDVGDELLIAVAKRLQANLRNTDSVARMGGDEFIVMSTGWAHAQQTHELGEKLLDAFHAPFRLRDLSCRVGITIGYVLAPIDGDNAVELVKRADTAMYAGKESGKHCVRRWNHTPYDKPAAQTFRADVITQA